MSPYCDEYGGAVMNATIDRYATVSLFPFDDKAIEIESIDYDTALKYDVDQFLAYDGHLDLIKGVVNYMRKTTVSARVSGSGFITMPLLVRG